MVVGFAGQSVLANTWIEPARSVVIHLRDACDMPPGTQHGQQAFSAGQSGGASLDCLVI